MDKFSSGRILCDVALLLFWSSQLSVISCQELGSVLKQKRSSENVAFMSKSKGSNSLHCGQAGTDQIQEKQSEQAN